MEPPDGHLMGRPARAIKRVPVLVRFEPDELERIDAIRGDTPRTVWIVQAAMLVAEATKEE
jgi:hypothetical protein